MNHDSESTIDQHLTLSTLRNDYNTLLHVALNLQKELKTIGEEINALKNIVIVDKPTMFNLRR